MQEAVLRGAREAAEKARIEIRKAKEAEDKAEKARKEAEDKVEKAAERAETMQLANIRHIMQNLKLDKSQAMDVLCIPQEERIKYASKL